MFPTTPTHILCFVTKRCDLTGIHYVTFLDCYSVFYSKRVHNKQNKKESLNMAKNIEVSLIRMLEGLAL